MSYEEYPDWEFGGGWIPTALRVDTDSPRYVRIGAGDLIEYGSAGIKAEYVEQVRDQLTAWLEARK